MTKPCYYLSDQGKLVEISPAQQVEGLRQMFADQGGQWSPERTAYAVAQALRFPGVWFSRERIERQP